MSLATLVPTAVGGLQATVASANIVKNILAGLVPSIAGIDAVTFMNKDISEFEFDYIGEERVEAGADITDHFTEANSFMQDHRSIKPTIIIMRGFVAEQAIKKSSIVSSILALSTALAPVTPYIGKYAPGTAAKMNAAVSQTDQIINQLTQILNIGGSIKKLIGGLAQTRVQQAYITLDALRNSGTAFIVVTPWATFGHVGSGHGPMMIEHLVMTSPDEIRGWADITVRLKEIRTAPSFLPSAQDNARVSQASTTNGSVTAILKKAGLR